MTRLELAHLIVFFTMLVVHTNSAPMVAEEKLARKRVNELTVADFDGYVGILRMFKDMLPGDVMGTLDSLNMTQKGELVSFLSDWIKDRIQKPTTKGELVELFKNHLPSVYDKISALNSTFYEKFNSLKPETQQLLRQWKEKAVNLTSGRPAGESAAQQLQLLREFALSVQNMDQTTRDDLRTQFPSAVSLTEGLGFTVFTTIALVFQKMLETVAGSPSLLATNLPIECPLPLD